MSRDPIIQRHMQLLTTISDEMGCSGELYDNFVEHMKGYAPRGLLKSKKTLLDKFDLLATKGHLKPGKYDVLKSIAKDRGNDDIMEMIERAEEDIKALENGSTDKNKSQLIEEGPSTSRSSSDTVNDSPRPTKRPRTDLEGSVHFQQLHGDTYDNTGKKGLLLILNSKKDRRDTEKDVEKLTDFYGENGLGFEFYDVREYEKNDLTTEEVELCLRDIRQYLNKNGKRYYCFVCVILSHGTKNGIITRDGVKSIEEIRHSFNNTSMPNFTGKPKVFLIQACRGSQLQTAHAIDYTDDEKRTETDYTDDEKGTEAERYEVEDEAGVIIHVPTDADTLLAYASTPGNVAHRRGKVGTWFITECMNVFNKCHRKHHLEEMLITVRANVAFNWKTKYGTKQMPCVWSTLTKRLMFTKDDTSY